MHIDSRWSWTVYRRGDVVRIWLIIDISMTHDAWPNLRHSAPFKMMQKKYINIYNGQNEKVSGHTTAKPRKNLLPVISNSY